jgi:hypothetical protein
MKHCCFFVLIFQLSIRSLIKIDTAYIKPQAIDKNIIFIQKWNRMIKKPQLVHVLAKTGSY